MYNYTYGPTPRDCDDAIESIEDPLRLFSKIFMCQLFYKGVESCRERKEGMKIPAGVFIRRNPKQNVTNTILRRPHTRRGLFIALCSLVWKHFEEFKF